MDEIIGYWAIQCRNWADLAEFQGPSIGYPDISRSPRSRFQLGPWQRHDQQMTCLTGPNNKVSACYSTILGTYQLYSLKSFPMGWDAGVSHHWHTIGIPLAIELTDPLCMPLRFAQALWICERSGFLWEVIAAPGAPMDPLVMFLGFIFPHRRVDTVYIYTHI